MANNKNIFFSVFALGVIACLFNTCKKIEDVIPATIIHATVRNQFSNQPIKNAIGVVAREEELDSPTPKVFILDTIFSDVNGRMNYRLHTKSRERYRYRIDISKPSECYSSYAFILEKGKENNLDARLVGSGSLSIYVKNQAPFDINDKICINANVYELYLNFPICYSGQNVDATILPISHYGNCFVIITWEVTKNNVSANYSDTIYVAPCITNTYNILY